MRVGDERNKESKWTGKVEHDASTESRERVASRRGWFGTMFALLRHNNSKDSLAENAEAKVNTISSFPANSVS